MPRSQLCRSSPCVLFEGDAAGLVHEHRAAATQPDQFLEQPSGLVGCLEPGDRVDHFWIVTDMALAERILGPTTICSSIQIINHTVKTCGGDHADAGAKDLRWCELF